jgi:hypothetical protein
LPDTAAFAATQKSSQARSLLEAPSFRSTIPKSDMTGFLAARYIVENAQFIAGAGQNYVQFDPPGGRAD